MTTETTTTAIGTITGDDLFALRNAEDITFHHLRADMSGGPQIRAYLRGYNRIWTGREQRMFPVTETASERRRDLLCESSAYGYDSDAGTGWRSADAPDLACFHMVHAAQYSDTWQTIARRALKIGDRLTLSWVADNNTETIRTAGLHADRLDLRVYRGTDTTPMVFAITTTVTLDNTARMIRRHG